MKPHASYNNKASLCQSNHSHRSKLEASVCSLLSKLSDTEILQIEDHIYLTDARILYIPDFKLRDTNTGEVYWAEAKGYANEKWPIKKRLWMHYGPGRLEIWKGTHNRPFLDEIIIPKVKSSNPPPDQL